MVLPCTLRTLALKKGIFMWLDRIPLEAFLVLIVCLLIGCFFLLIKIAGHLDTIKRIMWLRHFNEPMND